MWAVLDKWVTRTLTTVVFIVLARLLTPEEFGLVALALVIRHFLSTFIDQGFSEAIVQTPDLKPSFANTSFWTAILTGSFLTLALLFTAPFVARAILGDAAAAPFLRVLAISLLFTALSSTQSALLRREFAFRELAIRHVVAQLVAGAIAVAAAFMGAGAWSIVLQTILQGAVGAAILWRYSDWRPKLEFDRPTFRSLSVFGVSMVGIDVLTVVQQQADNFLIGRSLGAAALGLYALAFRFYFVVVDVTISSLSGVALPTFARVQRDLAATCRAFYTATRLTAIITLPIFAGMTVVAPEMISVLVGDRWNEAAPVLRALCPSGLILCLTYLDRSLIVALGRPRLALGVTAAGVALRFVGYLVGVQFGLVGVAVGLSATSIAYWPIRLIVLRRLAGVSIGRYARQFSSAVIAVSVMVSALLLVRSAMQGFLASWALLGAEVLIGGGAYTAALAMVDRASIRQLVDLVRPLVSREGDAPVSPARGRARGRLVRKLRQNWHWGRTHGWRDLIEEHDANPLVRVRRSLRKGRYRWTSGERDEPAKPVFLVGAQRSGTNMITHGLDEAPEFQVYNEGHTKAFEDYRLRPLPTIRSLIDDSRADFVLFKPLCDSHRAPELLDYFRPGARVIWAFRDVEGRTRSALAKFGDSNLQVLRAYAAGEADHAWQVQGISQENEAFIRSFDFDRLSAASGAALFWYVRNSLYFEMGLDRRLDTVLVSYDRFLAEPERAARALCTFLGLGYRAQLVKHVKPRPGAWSEPLSLDGRIRERCEELQVRMNEASIASVSRLSRS
ncbi:MAG: oligosaccharide flippase family protein [Actinomycetota bacterium]